MAKISAIQFGLRMATLFASEGNLLQAGRTALSTQRMAANSKHPAAPALYVEARRIASGARRRYRGANAKIKTTLSGIAFDSIFKVTPRTRGFLNGELAK